MKLEELKRRVFFCPGRARVVPRAVSTYARLAFPDMWFVHYCPRVYFIAYDDPVTNLESPARVLGICLGPAADRVETGELGLIEAFWSTSGQTATWKNYASIPQPLRSRDFDEPGSVGASDNENFSYASFFGVREGDVR